MSGKRKLGRNPEGSNLGKKRKVGSSAVISDTSAATGDLDTLESDPSPSVSVAESETFEHKQFVFKDPNFAHSNKQQQIGNKKGRSWKNLKQIIQMERSLPWKPDHPLYSRIDAPPSFKPAKKYSDLSGLPSLYTDPMTKLRYSSADEYSRASKLPSDIVAGLLQLRKANNLVP